MMSRDRQNGDTNRSFSKFSKFSEQKLEVQRTYEHDKSAQRWDKVRRTSNCQTSDLAEL